MKFISILTGLLLILILSCEDGDSGNGPSLGTDGGEDPDISNDITDYSICTDCIWLQNDCNGKWFVGYNTNSAIGGFQFDVNGAFTSDVSGGGAEDAGFTISHNGTTIMGFSFSGASIPLGYGKLLEFILDGTPTSLSNIVISSPEGESLTNISYFGLINCYYSNTLNNTGKSQLTIFPNSITNLSIGDEIGIFDSNAILNYNDCSNQQGELLVGSGVWIGNQLNIVSIGSIDLCSLEGVQIPGYVEGNQVIVKVWRSTENMEYDTQLTWEAGSGVFGDIIQSINGITLINPN